MHKHTKENIIALLAVGAVIGSTAALIHTAHSQLVYLIFPFLAIFTIFGVLARTFKETLFASFIITSIVSIVLGTIYLVSGSSASVEVLRMFASCPIYALGLGGGLIDAYLLLGLIVRMFSAR